MIGTRLGPYEIIEEIGKGGMATVFRAYQPSVDRFVAIKVIHMAIAVDRSSMERFQREARLVARLEHPHLLPVYDYDGAHNPPYIVMRYLEGGTLKEVILSHGALPLTDVGHVIRQVASALDYAHRQGVIHRDIKPTNIMIDQDGNAFLMDFGIARMTARTGAEGLTQTGFAVGTPSYMSPEQGMGAADISSAADIYSLGVMTFQMASGELPYTAETPMAIVLRHINDPVPKLRDFKADLPAALERTLMKAMAKKPEDRYATATEFAEDMTRAIESAGASGRPDVIRRAAQQNVAQIMARRQAHKSELDATMEKFESGRRQAATTPRSVSQMTQPAPSAVPPTPTPMRTRATFPVEDSETIITNTDDPQAPNPPIGAVGTPLPRLPAAPAPVSGTQPIPERRQRTITLVLPVVVGLLAVVAVVLLSQSGGGDILATETAAAVLQSTQTADALAVAQAATETAQPTSADATATADAPTPDTARPTADAAAAPGDTPAPTPATPIAVAVRSLILRAGPGTEYQRIGELAADSEVSIIGMTEEGDWFQVTLADGSIAWLSRSFVETQGSLNPVPFIEPPTPTPTTTLTPSDTPTPSLTPTDTPTATPTHTPTPARGFALAMREVALRSGPGSEYQQAGTLPANQEVQIIGKTPDETWLLVVLSNGRSAWLANSPLFVRTSGNLIDLPVIQAPTITPSGG
jgi:serine/threonine-protein kinase